MVKTPAAGISQKNQAMLVATDRVAALHPHGILTHSDSTLF